MISRTAIIPPIIMAIELRLTELNNCLAELRKHSVNEELIIILGLKIPFRQSDFRSERF